MVREVSNKSDLNGIKFGEDWIFTGWIDPPVDEDLEKWAKKDEVSRKNYLQLVEYAEKEAAKNALAEAELEDEKDEFDPKADEPILSDARRLDQRAFAKAYKVKDIRVLAESLKLPIRTGNTYIKEAQLVASIYKELNL